MMDLWNKNQGSITRNSMKVSSKKITHGNKILPVVKKQIENVTNYIHRIRQSSLFTFLMSVLLEIGLVER